MCYSHQTGLVKSQHVVLLLKHPRELEHQADVACVSSSVSWFSSPLPGNPHSTPTSSFSVAPSQVNNIWVTTTFNPLCRSSIYPKPFVLVPGPWSLSSLRIVSWVSQPVCTQTDHTWKLLISDPCGTRCSFPGKPMSEAPTQLSGRLMLPLPHHPSKSMAKWTPNICSIFSLGVP